MTIRSRATRWSSLGLGLALMVLGVVAATAAWASREGPPPDTSEAGDDVASGLRRAADSADWDAIDRRLNELEARLSELIEAPPEAAGVPAEAPDPAALTPVGPDGGSSAADEPGDAPWRARHVTRHRARVRREWHHGPYSVHPGESWDEHWEHFGERVGRHWEQVGERIGERMEQRGEAWGEHWGQIGERMGEHWGRVGERMGDRWGAFGERTGERWGAFGERAGRRFGRLGDDVGDRFDALGDELPTVIELSVDTVLDALDTLLDTLDQH